MEPVFFDGWSPVIRTLVLGAAGYAGLVVLLRVSGKRTLSKMNMFDFVVTIAFGSILASLMLSSRTTLSQGLAAVAVLVALQFVVTWLSVRVDAVSDIVKAEPRLLFSNGLYLRGAMREERVNEPEMHAAMRDSGFGSSEAVAAMVLETDGTISVIPKTNAGDGGVLPAPGEAP